MRTESTNTQSHAGDFSSENAVRRVFGRRGTSASTMPTTPAEPVHAGNGLPTETRQRRSLRRWNVAELLANAVVVPRNSVSRC